MKSICSNAQMKAHSLVFIFFVALTLIGCDNTVDYTLVSKKDEKTIIVSNEDNKILYESSNSSEAIEWALANSPIAIIREGKYTLMSHVSIPRPDVSLIITEKAVLKTSKNAEVIKVYEGHGGYFPMIYNKGHDNVNIFNLGTLNPKSFQSNEKEAVNVCVMYDGRNGGGNGIHGGTIFSSGKMLTTGDAVWVVDSENIQIPLLWTHTTCNTLCIEGSDNVSAGTIAELNNVGRPKGTGRFGNEAIDLNSYCRNFQCDLAIGTAPLEEAVDVNNSPDCTFNEVRAYGKPGNIFRVWQYKPHQRRLTQKAFIDNSDGTKMIKEGDYRDKIVSSWNTEFQVQNLLKNLPRLSIKTKLTGSFKNGPDEEIFNKTYDFHLSVKEDF